MRTNARIRNEQKMAQIKKNCRDGTIEKASEAENTSQALKGKARCLQTQTHKHIRKRRKTKNAHRISVSTHLTLTMSCI